MFCNIRIYCTDFSWFCNRPMKNFIQIDRERNTFA